MDKFYQHGSDRFRDSEKLRKMKMECCGGGEIDNTSPFGSVKEAVTRFGGSGFWIPMNLLREPNHGFVEFDINKVEEHAAKLEKDLTVKEKETLTVLKELELTKRIIEELKHKLQTESSSSQNDMTTEFDIPCPIIKEMDEKNCKFLEGNAGPASALGLILTELKQAKMSLSKTTNDLAVIRASVGSFNEKAEKHENNSVLEVTHEKLESNATSLLKGNPFADDHTGSTNTKRHFQNPTYISRELEQLNFEAEQFIKMAEAAKSDILRALSVSEQTTASMKTAEMKWVAAKKMEEAAKVVEAVALAEIKSLFKNSTQGSSTSTFPKNPDDEVTLSFQGRPNKKASLDAIFRVDESNISKLAIFKKLEEALQEVKDTKYALQDALSTVESANKRILAAEEALRRLKKWGFDNDHPSLSKPNNQVNDEKRPVLRPAISVEDILGKNKPQQVTGEEYVAIKRMQGERERDRQKVSLSQMLNRQRSSNIVVATSPVRCKKDRSSHDLKHFFAKNHKKFGFIHFSIPLSKQSKTPDSKMR